MSNAIATDGDLAWKTGPIRPRACTCGSVVCQLLHERVMTDMSRRMFVGGVAAMMAPFVGCMRPSPVPAACPSRPTDPCC